MAFLVAAIQNCHIDSSKQRPVRPYDVWHRPGEKRPKSSSLTVDAMHGLKGMFTKRNG